MYAFDHVAISKRYAIVIYYLVICNSSPPCLRTREYLNQYGYSITQVTIMNIKGVTSSNSIRAQRYKCNQFSMKLYVICTVRYVCIIKEHEQYTFKHYINTIVLHKILGDMHLYKTCQYKYRTTWNCWTLLVLVQVTNQEYRKGNTYNSFDNKHYMRSN